MTINTPARGADHNVAALQPCPLELQVLPPDDQTRAQRVMLPYLPQGLKNLNKSIFWLTYF